MIRIEQTLLTQMQITEVEITRRKEFLCLSRKDIALLVKCRPFIEEEIDVIVADFYRIQISIEEIALLIGDADTLKLIHAAQRNYVLDLFSGCTDIEYVNNRLRIGLVHKRIGVEPKLYLSAVKTLKDIITKVLQHRIHDTAVLADTCQALDKLLYFDITLVFDTYIRSLVSEVETAKVRVESYAATLELQVAERTAQLEEKVVQLETALAAVKRLEGVIPICGVCKKIRDDKESWQQLEQYISEHSEAMFSHGLCPECFEKEMRKLRGLKATGENTAEK
jgi:diguanylate cyclase